jgi:hypothetical protein
MAEQLIHRGTLEGHSGWVTSLATSHEKCDASNDWRWILLTGVIVLICSCQEVETRL